MSAHQLALDWSTVDPATLVVAPSAHQQARDFASGPDWTVTR